jgi:hypothetical protein
MEADGRDMTLTINLPEEETLAIEARAKALGISANEYVQRVIERDLAPDWLRRSWAAAREAGLDQLSMEEIDAEIAAAREARRISDRPSDASRRS